MNIYDELRSLGEFLCGLAEHKDPALRQASLEDAAAQLERALRDVNREIVQLRYEVKRPAQEGGFVMVLSLVGIAIIACLLLVVCGAIATAPAGSLSLAPARPDPNRIVLETLPPFIIEAPILQAEALPDVAGESDIPEIGHVIWGTHATDKHGQDAMIARAATLAGGKGSFWKCHDDYRDKDKLYSINQVLERLPDSRVRAYWTLTILSPLADKAGWYQELSSYVIGDQGKVQGLIERDHCKNPWQMIHP